MAHYSILRHLYTAGYDEIDVKYTQQKLPLIRKSLHHITGLEIVEVGPTHCKLKCMSHLEEIAGFIRLKKKGYVQELDYNSFYKEYKDAPTEDIFPILAENLHAFFQERRNSYLKATGNVHETILNLSKKDDIQEIGSLIKSKIAFDILLKADGTRTTTDIAKELNKSIATISTYAGNLKKMNYIRILEDGKLKRNIKGVKINLEQNI